jgi:hypothetical protein
MRDVNRARRVNEQAKVSEVRCFFACVRTSTLRKRCIHPDTKGISVSLNNNYVSTDMAE